MTRSEKKAQYKRIIESIKGTEHWRPVLRKLICTDLFFLLVFILNRKDIDHDFLFARCREVQASPDGHLDLWAREHGKSSIITYAKTIQDLLIDPELTVGIFSHTRPIAKGFLRQIKREFENNVLLKQLFPDILWENPKRDAPKWSDDEGIILRRKENPKEATIEAYGMVDGQPSSKHFSLRVYDDVVTRESVTTPEQIVTVTSAWELSLNLGTMNGRERYIGTRYHYNDTYKTMLDRKTAIPRIYPATQDGTEKGVPVLMSPELLAKKRRDMGPYVFGSQMLLNPTADRVQGFKVDWIRYYQTTPTGGNRYLLCDPAGEKKKTNDFTVQLVIELGEDQNYYLLDGVRARMNLTERTKSLMKLHRKHRPIGVGYEKYGKDSDIEHIRYVQDTENYRFEIFPLGGSMPKNDRIRKLVPVFEQFRWFLAPQIYYIHNEGTQGDLVQEFLTEYRDFPVSEHDDVLDCAARILDEELHATFPAPVIPGGNGRDIAQTVDDSPLYWSK